MSDSSLAALLTLAFLSGVAFGGAMANSVHRRPPITYVEHPMDSPEHHAVVEGDIHIHSNANCDDGEGGIGPCGVVFGRDEDGNIKWPE